MRPSRIRRKLLENQPVLLTTLHLADPAVFELASLMGFDGLWLDMEHHAHSMETAQNLMRAARVGQSDVLVRPAKGEFMRMARMLEIGAQGIMYPRCQNAAEAAEVVKWAKFAPLGCRGLDGGNADASYGTSPAAQYIREANEQTFVVIQIEDQEALDQAEDIAAVEGVDVIFLGPGDYSVLGGYPGQIDHPELARATERIAAAARRAGKHWGRPVIATSEEAEKYLAMGARFLSYSGDLAFVRRGLEQVQRDYRAIGFTFENQLPSRTKPSGPAPHISPRDGAPLTASDRHHALIGAAKIS